MGIYKFTIAVPANTPRDKPVELEIKLYETYLDKAGIFFPNGQVYMVETALFYGEYQEVPNPEGEWLAGDGQYIEFPVRTRYREAPVRLTIKAHSEGTRYDHEVYWFLWTEEPYVYIVIQLLRRLAQLWERFMKLFRIPIR